MKTKIAAVVFLFCLLPSAFCLPALWVVEYVCPPMKMPVGVAEYRLGSEHAVRAQFRRDFPGCVPIAVYKK